MAIDYSRVLITYLHPLLGPVHCLQVTRRRRRVDEIVRQKLDPTTTSRGGPRHWRRTDWLRILNFWRMDDYFQVRLWQYIVTLPFGYHGGSSAGYLRWLGGYSGGFLGLRHQAFNGYSLVDGASLGFGPCQQKTYGLVSLGGHDYSLRKTASAQVLTFYYAGLRQCSLHDRRLGLSLGEESGLLSGWRGTLFSHCRTGFIHLPG
jgi:hypothetical protein